MIVPPDDVVAAFGADGSALRRLAGGQERTWTDGQIVLKPVDNPVEHTWVCDVFDAWPEDAGVRVPRGLRSPDGSWVYHGWAAHGFVPGRSARMTWEPELIRSAGEAFHRQTAALDRPGFLDERTDAWSEGDRVAWEDADPVAADVTLEQIHRLRAAFAPVEGASQVIHGDLGGNVLVSDDGGPVVIDWPPYFRPPGFALAVAVGDAVRWEDVPVWFIDAWRDVPDWYQLLARALVYRLATAGIQQQDGRANLSPEDHAATSEPAVALVLDRLSVGQR